MNWVARLRILAIAATLAAVLVLVFQVQHLARVNTDQARTLANTKNLVDQLAACQNNPSCIRTLLGPLRTVVQTVPEPIQMVMIPGPAGRDGRDGQPGSQGVPGESVEGPQGPPGADGKDAPTPTPTPTSTEAPTPSPSPTECVLPPAFC
jgi:hypothetical protein